MLLSQQVRTGEPYLYGNVGRRGVRTDFDRPMAGLCCREQSIHLRDAAHFMDVVERLDHLPRDVLVRMDDD